MLNFASRSVCGSRWFATFIAIASLIWASYAASLGYIGGKAFADNHTVAFIVAFAMALSATGVIELVRHLRHKRRIEAA